MVTHGMNRAQFEKQWLAIGGVCVIAVSLWVWANISPSGFLFWYDKPVSSEEDTLESGPMPADSDMNKSVSTARADAVEMGRSEIDRRRYLVRIIDANDIAIENAEIRLFESLGVLNPSVYEPWPRVRPPVLGISAGDGTVNLPATLRSKRVVVFAAGKTPRSIYLPENVSLPTIVQLSDADGSTLTVASETGHRIGGARILLDSKVWGWSLPSRQGSYFELGVTDQNGVHKLPRLVSRNAVAIVAADGYALARVEVIEGDVHIALGLAETVAGQVIGIPKFVGYHIYAEPMNSKRDLPVLRPVEGSGRFVFTNLSAQSEWLLTICEGIPHQMKPASGSKIVIPPEYAVELRLDQGSAVRVHAIDAVGNSLDPFLLGALFPQQVLADTTHDSALQGIDGSWQWSVLRVRQPKTQKLWVGAKGFLPLYVGTHEFTPGKIVDLGRVRLKTGSQWQVRVIEADSQREVEGARVTFAPHREPAASEQPWVQMERSDNVGVCVLLWDAPMGGELTVSKKGWATNRIEIQSEPEDITEIVIARSAIVRIKCFTLDGGAAVSAAIAWRLLGESGWRALFMDRSGEAVIETSAGILEIRYEPSTIRRLFNGMEAIMNTSNQKVELELLFSEAVSFGETSEVKIILPILGKAHIILSVGGESAPGYRVEALPPEGLDASGYDSWSVLDVPKGITDRNGELILEKLVVGERMFAVTDQKGTRRWRVPVVVPLSGERSILVELPLRDLNVRVEDERGMPLANVPLRVVSLDQGYRFPVMALISPSGQSVVTGLAGLESRLGMTAITNKDGLAIFRGLPSDVGLRVSCVEPHEFPLLESVDLGMEVSADPATLRNGRASALRIEIITNDDGADPNNVVVWLSRIGGYDDRMVNEALDSSGFVNFSGLHPGRWRIAVSPYGETRVIELVVGQMHHERLDLRF